MKNKENKKVIIIVTIILVILLLGVGICVPFLLNDDKEVVNRVSNIEKETSIIKEKESTWQEDATDTRVTRAFSNLYMKDGVSGDLNSFYEDLKDRLKSDEDKNLFLEKFEEEFNKINYNEMEQLQKDILNGLIYYIADGGENFNIDVPFEKAWLVGAGANNTNAQKHRKVVIKLQKKYVDVGLEMDFWINKKDNKEYHSANYVSFGDNTILCGIDVNTDSGIWSVPISDYYNNKKYELIDLNYANDVINKNKEFIAFMQEYIKDIQVPALKAENDKIKENNKLKEPSIGMTESEVLNSTWGSPKRKNVDTFSWGTTAQWVYDKGYIYFKNGRVTSISTSE